MGQYLAIGLVTKIKIEKNKDNKILLNIENLQEKMQDFFHFVPQIYRPSEDDDSYMFILREDIINSQLIPLLEIIYPLLYENPEHYDNILKKLRILPSSKWIQWAKNKQEEAFQFDKYGMCDFLKENNSKICLHYEAILLSMEGKIGMEAFGRQFNFLKYTMTQAFREMSLAGSLRIYITG